MRFSNKLLNQFTELTSSFDWRYLGDNGEENWHKLHEECIVCKEGLSQSPIDLNKQFMQYDSKLPKMDIEFNLTKYKVLHNRNNIVIRPVNDEYITFNDEVLDMLQFHFHVPSEHTLDGENLPMEMHLVFANSKHVMVVGIFGEQCADESEADFSFNLNDEEQSLDLNCLFDDKRKYLSYSGSMTTPPCYEQVDWVIMEHKVKVSSSFIEELIKTHGKNNRQVQALNGRVISRN